MFLLKLAWKNMWRNRHRTLITMAAIFFAVILSVFASSLKEGIFDNLVKNVVSFYTGYVQVHKMGYQEKLPKVAWWSVSTPTWKMRLRH
jgi:putative ABC transport system permease protein